MSKGASKPVVAGAHDLSQCCRSSFRLTFVVEVIGLEVWEDFNEGWLEQGSCVQGLKLQCQLYPGQTFDLDIMIWPHTAKIWCGNQYGWVRTWQFLQRRWLAFSISFTFPVRVLHLQNYMATIIPSVGVGSFGSNAKSDKDFNVYLPPLGFGVRRHFAPVLESEVESLSKFLKDVLWHAVETYIPASCFDELFDVPHVVTDARHQDTCLDTLRDLILSRLEPPEPEEAPPELEEHNVKERRESKSPTKEKDKKKVPEAPKVKLEITLSGESILAGTGRIVPFETFGEPLPDSPEIIVLISSYNLPAQDDLPIVFLNIENLFQIPLNELKILRITQLYTKWQIGDEIHCSEPQSLKAKSIINFKDHRALPIPFELLPTVTSVFLETSFRIELRGIRLPSVATTAKLFGYEKGDRDFGRSVPKPTNEELDFLIAITKIDARTLSRGVNGFLRGEYPLYPPPVKVKSLEREVFCTNDINSIRMPVAPNLVVRPDVILQAQMTLEVSIGVVGCKTRKLFECYSRMFCAIKDSEAVMTLLRGITDINEDIILSGEKEDLMSGFALDTGCVVILYLEGPKDGHILRIWDMTEDFYPKVKPVFSCSDRYSSRLYPEFIAATVPFIILKMFAPLGVILACPPVYARPALPLPTRSALLKIGNLVKSDNHSFPSRWHMPTAAELKSFRLELCVAPRPTLVIINDNTLSKTVSQDQARASVQSVSRINWDK